MKQGIYCIRNAINGRVYVGSSVNIERRLKHHFYLLKAGRHHSPALQHSYVLHPEQFASEILEEVVDAHDLIAREQFWIDSLKSYGAGYNGKPLAGKTQLGRRHTDAARAKMSVAKTGKPTGQKGVKRNAEFRAKCSAWQQGKVVPREWIERMRRARKPLSQESRAKIAAAHLGKIRGPLSPAHKAKISAAGLGRKASDTHRARVSAARMGMQFSDSHRAKLSESRRKMLADKKAAGIVRRLTPEQRQNVSNAIRKWHADRRLAAA